MSIEFPEPTPPRSASDWGLASTIVGAVLVTIAPGGLLLNAHAWTTGRRPSPAGRIALAVGFQLLILASLVGLLFALIALTRTRDQPKALGYSGVVLNLLAAYFWIGLTLDLFALFGILRL